MFFDISQQPQLNFSHFYKLGQFCVSTDAGWSTSINDRYHCLYKGYVDSCSLESALNQIVQDSEPRLLGNFCVIVYDAHADELLIKSDRCRGFPIYFDSNSVSNLNKKSHTAWTDSLIKIQNTGSVVESKFDVIGEIDSEPLNFDQAVTYIDQVLSNKIQNFLAHNTQPIKAFLSGGVDSLLVYSYLQKFTNNYELVRGQHFDYDKFWMLNSETIGNSFWGYKQLHHWRDSCVLTSGAPGDEFMLRSPATVDLFLKFHNQSVVDLLDSDWKSCLHREYFCRPKHLKLFQTQIIDRSWTKESLIWNLCNIVVNDWQHWHLGNTLTWTPLRDLEIFKTLLRLPVTVSMGQIFDSEISRLLIEKNQPGLSQVISDQKNSGNPLSNLIDLYDKFQ